MTQPVSLRLVAPGLGMLDELPTIREGEVILEPDSLITCYTDGVVELENVREREFGESKLELILLTIKTNP